MGVSLNMQKQVKWKRGEEGEDEKWREDKRASNHDRLALNVQDWNEHLLFFPEITPQAVFFEILC